MCTCATTPVDDTRALSPNVTGQLAVAVVEKPLAVIVWPPIMIWRLSTSAVDMLSGPSPNVDRTIPPPSPQFPTHPLLGSDCGAGSERELLPPMLGRVIWSMSKAVPMFPLAPMASPLYEVATWAKLTEGHSRKAAKNPRA